MRFLTLLLFTAFLMSCQEDRPDKERTHQHQLDESSSRRIEHGKSLYNEYCTPCHHKDLRKVLTGPALGNVHLFRSQEWLIEFTQDPYGMIAEGDSLAVGIWHSWQPVIMRSFDTILTRAQIIDIYQFIKNESAVQGIDSNEVEYIIECKIFRDKDINGYDRYFSHVVTNKDKSPKGDPIVNLDYLLYAHGYEDFFNQKERLGFAGVGALTVHLEPKVENVYLSILAILVDRKQVLPLMLENGLYKTSASDQSFLPIGESVILVAMTRSDGYWFGTKTIEIGQNNRHRLEVHRSSEEEIFEFLERL